MTRVTSPVKKKWSRIVRDRAHNWRRWAKRSANRTHRRSVSQVLRRIVAGDVPHPAEITRALTPRSVAP